jgi:tRNA-modifying protein YgfZ
MTGSDKSLLRQYEAVNGGAGFVAFSPRTLLEITGADRIAFINSFCTNDVKRLQPGQGCEAFFTNHQGKTVGHGLIFVHDDSLVYETTAGQAQVLVSHLDRFLISERVEFHDRSQDWAQFFIGGRACRDINWTSFDQLPTEMLTHRGLQVGGQPAVVRRVGFTCAPGWLVQTQTSNAPAMAEALKASGLTPVEPSAFEVCRIEAGWPMYGADITVENLPQEINRDQQAISFKKGCYLGQETVARLDALGHVNRLLVEIELNSQSPPAVETALFQGEKEIGKITSSSPTPGQEASIALALVRRTAATIGTMLQHEAGEAYVVKLPRC